MLGGAVKDLLPTPVANDDHKTPEAHIAAKNRDGANRQAITSLEVMSRQAAETGQWSSRLLPTPQARDGKGVPGDGFNEISLPRSVSSLLPTPRTSDAKGPGAHGDGGPDLRTQVQTLLPTPTAGGAKSSRNSTANRNSIPPSGLHAGDTLTDFVTLLPTPTARDHKDGAGTTWHPEKGKLPHTIGALIGETTSEPSDDTNDS